MHVHFSLSIIYFLSWSLALSALHLTTVPKVMNGSFYTTYTLYVSDVRSNIIEYSYARTDNEIRAVRVHVTSNDATENFPVLVVVKQQLGIASWQIPYTYGVNRWVVNLPVSETLCPVDDYSEKLNDVPYQMVTIDVSTMSTVTRQVTVMAEFQTNFLLELDKPVTVYASPSQPQYFQVSFPDGVDHLFIHVTSNSSVCSYVSIQDALCPVYDQEKNVKFEGSFQSMTKSSSIVALKDAHPHDFFVVLVVASDDEECNGHSGSLITDRTKQFTVKASKMLSKSQYNAAVFGVFGFFLCFYIFAIIVIVVTFVFFRDDSTPNLEKHATDDIDLTLAINENQHDSASVDNVDAVNRREKIVNIDEKNKLDYRQSVYVNHLATKGTKRLAKKSNAYCWVVLIIAVLYAVPVVQLVMSYQTTSANTGNQDICYYNFLCAYPNGYFSDFNHMFSNIGYVMLGFLFIFIIFVRDLKFRTLARKCPELSEGYGVPRHFGFFYAMGLALVMEGVLSGCYHICPSHTNFQFDTSFMYMISGLCMLKIYHTRHPDINANVIDAALFYAGVIFLAFIGVYVRNVAKWILFSLLYFIICVAVSVKVYHVGLFKWRQFIKDKRIIQKSIRSFIKEFREPKSTNRLILLTVGFCINLALNIIGLVMQPGDFDTFLLAIFIVNLLLYLIYYVIMKNIKKEKIQFSIWCFTCLSLVVWIASLYFFVSHKYMSTSATPAVSREVNINCIMFDFYDYHDIWHFLSAIAMFISFLTLLHLDDELATKERRKIPVF